MLNLNFHISLTNWEYIAYLQFWGKFPPMTNQVAFLMFAHLFERNKEDAIQTIAHAKKPSLWQDTYHKHNKV
jgi:hypothetical protein